MKNIDALKFLFLLLFSSVAISGGRTTPAVPTKIDTVGVHSGFMIWGAFGNPAGCTKPDAIWVKGEHSQYDKIYSTALAAFMAGKKVNAYAHSCEPVGWYSTADVTYNVLGPSGDLQIQD